MSNTSAIIRVGMDKSRAYTHTGVTSGDHTIFWDTAWAFTRASYVMFGTTMAQLPINAISDDGP